MTFHPMVKCPWRPDRPGYIFVRDFADTNMHTIIFSVKSPLTPCVGSKGQKISSKSSHFANQIKENVTNDIIQANILPLHTSLTL